MGREGKGKEKTRHGEKQGAEKKQTASLIADIGFQAQFILYLLTCSSTSYMWYCLLPTTSGTCCIRQGKWVRQWYAQGGKATLLPSKLGCTAGLLLVTRGICQPLRCNIWARLTFIGRSTKSNTTGCTQRDLRREYRPPTSEI